MTLQSEFKGLGVVLLPTWQGRQKYMISFDSDDPVMPEGFEDYAGVAHSLCRKAGALGREVHMTVDEKVVEAGMSQRRPGAHVDGCYMPTAQAWGHPLPSWVHYSGGAPVERMAIIVASSVPGCIVYPGTFEGEPKSDGDLEHIRDQFGDAILLLPDEAFLLSPDCVHESMVFNQPTKRTFLRIAFTP